MTLPFVERIATDTMMQGIPALHGIRNVNRQLVPAGNRGSGMHPGMLLHHLRGWYTHSSSIDCL